MSGGSAVFRLTVDGIHWSRSLLVIRKGSVLFRNSTNRRRDFETCRVVRAAAEMLTNLSSSAAVQEFIQKPNAIVTFSAHWCGPCKASHGHLEELAKASVNKAAFGIAYESDLGDDLHNYRVRAFPTYILFQNGAEKARVEGVNFAGIEAMMNEHCQLTGGETLGGGSSVSPQDARAARLAKLGGSTPAADAKPPPPQPDEPMEVDKVGEDVEMEDAKESASAKDSKPAAADPTAGLDKVAVETLESMGFSTLRAQKALLKGNGSVEGAIEWLDQHQDDPDIDDPIEATSTETAQSYKCNECGKILSNMANLELHANKTGHSDFEESTEAVKPLTAEEKQAKIEEIKQLLKAKRDERENAEKVDQTTREIQRRNMGKEMAKTREQMEVEQRKREAQQRRREKQEFQKERARIRAELAKDKAERVANKGKLSSKLGVDGYNPDGIQYDVDAEGGADGDDKDTQVHKEKKLKASAGKIDEYIAKVSSYRAGGDGGKCLKLLLTFVGNVVDNPDEDKFKSINTEGKAYRLKIKQFIGARNILLAVGFSPDDSGRLVLKEDADRDLLISTKTKLEEALKAFG